LSWAAVTAERAPADVVSVVVAMLKFRLLWMSEPNAAGAVTLLPQTGSATSCATWASTSTTPLTHGPALVEALAQVVEAREAAAEGAEVATEAEAEAAVVTTTIEGAGVVGLAPVGVVAAVVTMPKSKLLSMSEPNAAGAVTSPLQTRFATSCPTWVCALMTPLIHGLGLVEPLAQVVEPKEAAAEVAEVATEAEAEAAVMTTTIGGAGAMTTTIAIAAADVMTAMIGAAVVTLVIAIAAAELHRLRGKQPLRQKYQVSSPEAIQQTWVKPYCQRGVIYGG